MRGVPRFSGLGVVALGITAEAFGFDSENFLSDSSALPPSRNLLTCWLVDSLSSQERFFLPMSQGA